MFNNITRKTFKLKRLSSKCLGFTEKYQVADQLQSDKYQ